MTYQICYWDDIEQMQKERDSTPEEDLQREADIAAASSPVVPKSVTRRQALSALRVNGVTGAMIETAIAGLPISDLQKDLAIIEFRESLEFEHGRALVVQLCAIMSLDRDALFTLAGTL